MGLEDGVDRDQERQRDGAAGHEADQGIGRVVLAVAAAVRVVAVAARLAAEDPDPDREIEQEAEEREERDEGEVLHRSPAGGPPGKESHLGYESGWIL